MSNINQLITEVLNIKNKKLYRSGSIQDIKIFSPKNPIKTHNKSFDNKQLVYATDDIEYAAGFCFSWSNSQGFEFGRIDQGSWTLEVPKKYKNKLNHKCSMYELENNTFKKINIRTPEYYSIEPVKVVKEIKFNSCYKCLKKYNVILKII